jgi:NAD+ diphosphatase
MSFFDGAPLGAPAGLGFAAGLLDRAAQRREDADWLDAARNAPSTRFVALCRDTPLLGHADGMLEPLFTRDQTESLGTPVETLFLGLDGDAARFAVDIAPDRFDALKERDDLKLIDMRSIAMQGLFTPGILGAIGIAKALFGWHQRHRFCSNCGAPSTVAAAGWKRACPACKSEHFPRTDPVVIMLTIDGDRCLMGRGAQFPEGRYSCLAGFVEPGETLEDAVRRETFEETNIRTGRVRYLFAQPWPFPSSIMIGCLAEATSTEITIDPNEIADARWFTRDEVRQILAGTHPAGLTAPPPMAIANHIMQLFVDGG